MDDGTVKLSIKKQLEESIEMRNEEIDGKAASPASRRLFEISENAESLDKQQSDLFHSIVAKLYMSAKEPDLT